MSGLRTAGELDTVFVKNPRASNLAPLRLGTQFASSDLNSSEDNKSVSEHIPVKDGFPPRLSGTADGKRYSVDPTVPSLEAEIDDLGLRSSTWASQRRFRDVSSSNVQGSKFRGRGSLPLDDFPESNLSSSVAPSRVRRTLRLDSLQPATSVELRDRGLGGETTMRSSKTPSSINLSHRSLSPVATMRRRMESEGAASPLFTVDMSPSPMSLPHYTNTEGPSFVTSRSHSQSAFGVRSEQAGGTGLDDTTSDGTRALTSPSVGNSSAKKKKRWGLGKLFKSKKKPEQIPIPNAVTKIDLSVLNQEDDFSKSGSRRSSRLFSKFKRDHGSSTNKDDSLQHSGSQHSLASRSHSLSSAKNFFTRDSSHGGTNSEGTLFLRSPQLIRRASAAASSRRTSDNHRTPGSDDESNLSLMPPAASAGDTASAKRKKKAWYQKMFGGGSKKSKRSGSHVEGLEGDRHSVSFSPGDTGLTFPNVQVTHVDDVSTNQPTASSQSKKSKGGWSIFGSKKKKPKPAKEETSSVEQDFAISKLYEEDEKPAVKPGYLAPVGTETTAAVVVTEKSINEEEQVRLARLRDETKDEFLNALRDIQKRFFIKQGKHCLWKYQNLKLLLSRDQDGMNEKKSREQDWDDLQLEEFLEKQEKRHRSELQKQAQGLLHSSKALIQVAQTGKLQDLKRVDWRVVALQEQVDSMRVAFSMSQVTKLIHQMFEDEEFQKAMKELFRNTEDQMEGWVSQGYLNGVEGTSQLTCEEFKKMGHLRQGQVILDHMDELMCIAANHANESYYVEMNALANEVDTLHKRITKLIDAAFDYMKSQLIPEWSRHVTEGLMDGRINMERYHPQIPNDYVELFVLPRFLQDRLRVLPSLSPKPNSSKFSEQPPTDILEKKEMMLRRLANRERRPVGDGFLLLATRQDMEATEVRLAGKYGSYNLFEKWLHEALKWQWQDVALQDNLRKDKETVERVIEDKKRYIKEMLEKRLTQLWSGRAIAAKETNVEKLTKYLSEALTRRPPIIITAKGHEIEVLAMQLEEEKAQCSRVLNSEVGRELLRSSPAYKRTSAFITNVDDIIKLQTILTDIHKALEKDLTIIGDLELQTILGEIKREVEKVWDNVSELQRLRQSKEATLEKQRTDLDNQHQSALAALEKERSALADLGGDQGVSALALDLEALKEELESVKMQVKLAQTDSKKNKSKYRNLEKEYKATKKKLMDEQKAQEKAEKEAELTSKQLEEEFKKYQDKLRSHGLDPNRLYEPMSDKQSDDVSEVVLTHRTDSKLVLSTSMEARKKKKKWWTLGGGSSKRTESHSNVSPSRSAADEKVISQISSFDPTKPEPATSPPFNTAPPIPQLPIVYKEEPLLIPAVEKSHSVTPPCSVEAPSEPQLLLPHRPTFSRVGSEIQFRRKSDFPGDRRFSIMSENTIPESDGPVSSQQEKKRKPLWKKLVKVRSNLSKPGAGKKSGEGGTQMSSQVMDDLLGQRLSEPAVPPLPPHDHTPDKKKKKGWGWLGMGKKRGAKKSEEDSIKSAAGSRETSWRKRLSRGRSRRASNVTGVSSFDASVASLPLLPTRDPPESQPLETVPIAMRTPGYGSMDGLHRQRTQSIDYVPEGPANLGSCQNLAAEPPANVEAYQNFSTEAPTLSSGPPFAFSLAQPTVKNVLSSQQTLSSSNMSLPGGLLRPGLRGPTSTMPQISSSPNLHRDSLGYHVSLNLSDSDEDLEGRKLDFDNLIDSSRKLESLELEPGETPAPTRPVNPVPEAHRPNNLSDNEAQSDHEATLMPSTLKVAEEGHEADAGPSPRFGGISSLTSESPQPQRLDSIHSGAPAQPSSPSSGIEQEPFRSGAGDGNHLILQVSAPAESPRPLQVLARTEAFESGVTSLNSHEVILSRLTRSSDEEDIDVVGPLQLPAPSPLSDRSSVENAQGHTPSHGSSPRGRYSARGQTESEGGKDTGGRKSVSVSFEGHTSPRSLDPSPRQIATFSTPEPLLRQVDRQSQSDADSQVTKKSSKSVVGQAFGWLTGSSKRRASVSNAMMVGKSSSVLPPSPSRKEPRRHSVSPVPAFRTLESPEIAADSKEQSVYIAKANRNSDLPGTRFRRDMGVEAAPLLSDLLCRTTATCLLRDDEIMNVARNTDLQAFDAGDALIRIGDSVEYLYFIQKGSLIAADAEDIEVDSFIAADAIMDNLVAGFIHGQTLRLPKSPVKIKASSKCLVWPVSLKKLRATVEASRMRIKQELTQTLTSIHVLKSLSRSELTKLALSLRPHILSDPVFLDGKTTAFWIVWQGCMVASDTENEKVEQYHQGDIFGLDDFGQETPGAPIHIQLTASQQPTVVFEVKSSDIEKAAGEPMHELLSRYREQ
eukprot:Gregarina_sp_Poly_1__7570@NODE_423_length_8651_cov_79_752796_g345_i0_p1_GENE_NODE_423_length_8651_cov_79_752796_g345_i0NODE_423_length_8651_cov_79_752796_g345_i0_p1_ORF_typecomplete_len2346_score406_63cNMP_binding/PF00027_29/0_0038cNMP_binding/PF00027_29/24_NODE_423_length_8651_cov_79_752796_g345_i015878624